MKKWRPNVQYSQKKRTLTILLLPPSHTTTTTAGWTRSPDRPLDEAVDLRHDRRPLSLRGRADDAREVDEG